jgi:cytochrome c oxidase subunit 3
MLLKINTQGHPFHIVTSSPWPITGAMGALTSACGGVLYMHGYNWGGLILTLGFVLIVSTMVLWWSDVIHESVYEGKHTREVQRGLRIGMFLFIISEVMFFGAFFWGFFYSGINPSIEILFFPPSDLFRLSAVGVPLLNTGLLLSSGGAVTYAHHALLIGRFRHTFEALFQSVVLGFIFIYFQAFEYLETPFFISDGVFGSSFFLLTGFHGFHVVVGLVFIFICLERLKAQGFSKDHHIAFEAALWYWHFVDVIWLFLFLTAYS